VIQSPHDHFSAAYKRCKHNSYPLSPKVIVPPSVIPAKAGIHCGDIISLVMNGDLLEYV
jgi:hypothetical protein